ncbi:hypothetical protein K432DRAFT_383143 [Lepidopterella palustris CBS 459.81]|uniref:DNA-directed RNA polymerase III subunit n=1 Tax=Lepidopterella palustris CBS 459.81 TaxID=1314670 RepID=A0A8E2E8S5_9PEZI|nr:hypothetical protein K432DRAFT_383143 [Lepidopterella palustris CBS 459.81]
MSRGGRGGARGGGFGRGKTGGLDLPWENDPELEIKTKPTELFPPLHPPSAPPARRNEKIAVQRYRALRDRIHEGPLYTLLGDSARVTKGGLVKGGPPPAALFDPFLGTPTYSQKYQKQRRRIPRLDTRPYVKEFFPVELWAILDPTHATTTTATTANGAAPPKQKQKRLQISKSTAISRLERMEQDEARKQNDGDDDDDDEEKERDDEELPQEEDNDYEDDEEDDDDYNAENYFDNGEEDYDDGGGNEGDSYE